MRLVKLTAALVAAGLTMPAFAASGGTTHLTNNLVAFNGWYGVYKGTYGAVGTVSHNNVFGSSIVNYSGLPDATGTDGNISVDPLFVNRANADYHLREGSPSIDTGTRRPAVMPAGSGSGTWIRA